MKLEVNITKKYFFGILAGVLVLAGVFGVIASHISGTPNPGHDISQVGGIPTCPAGQFLTHDSGGLKCAAVSGGSGGGSVCVSGNSGASSSSETVDVSLLVGGVNICEDPKGCDVMIYTKIDKASGGTVGTIGSIEAGSYIRLKDTDNWGFENFDDDGVKKGIEGAGNDLIAVAGSGCQLYDDYTGKTLKTGVVLRDIDTQEQCFVSICSRG